MPRIVNCVSVCVCVTYTTEEISIDFELFFSLLYYYIRFRIRACDILYVHGPAATLTLHYTHNNLLYVEFICRPETVSNNVGAFHPAADVVQFKILY